MKNEVISVSFMCKKKKRKIKNTEELVFFWELSYLFFFNQENATEESLENTNYFPAVLSIRICMC